MERMITDERTGLQYELCGNVYLLAVKEDPVRPLGRWGRRHLEYLKTNKRICYYQLLTSGRLSDYLSELDRQAEEMYWRLIRKYAEREEVTEQLKANDQVEWVRRMNNIRERVTVVVNNELITV